MSTCGTYDRRRNPRFFSVLAVASLCLGGALAAGEDVRERAPRPSLREHVDYLSWLNNERAVAAELNAARAYIAAAASIEPIEDRAALKHASAGPWHDLPAVRSWLDRQEGALGRFRDASQAERSYLGIKSAAVGPGGPDWHGAMIRAVVPGLGVFEEAAEGLLAQGWQAWSAGDKGAIIDNALATLRASHHLEHEWTMVAKMTSLTVAERSYYALAQALSRSDDPASLAASLSGRLAAADSPLADMTDAYLFQKLTAWDILQRVYVSDGADGSWQVHDHGSTMYRHLTSLVSGESPPWEDVRASLVSTGFTKDLAEVSAYFDRLLEWSGSAHHLAAAGEGAISASGEGLSDLMMRVFVRGMTTPRRQCTRAAAVQHGTRLLVNVLAYRKETGRYCDSLDALAELRGIEQWIVDPYSGRPFVYARTREGFVLYSVGPDRKDDAARPFLPGGEAGDLVIWPVP